MSTVAYRIELTEEAEKDLVELRDLQAQRKIANKIDGLAFSPSSQGKPLRKELSGYRSLKMARYRIIYAVDEPARVVTVYAVGIRKDGDNLDVYYLMRKRT